MRILIDESLPRYLKQVLTDHEVFTVQEMDWAGIQNGELLEKAESNFQVFLTADKNLRYQQDLGKFSLAFIVFPTNRLGVVKSLASRIKEILVSIKQGEIIEL